MGSAQRRIRSSYSPAGEYERAKGLRGCLKKKRRPQGDIAPHAPHPKNPRLADGAVEIEMDQFNYNDDPDPEVEVQL
jgi:hypothetical protein